MRRNQFRTGLALLVGVALLAIYGWQWARVDHSHIGGSDFSATYVGAGLWRDGHHADLYSEALQTARHAQVNAPEPASPLPFVNPPVAAVLAAPVTLLSLDHAYRLWVAAQCALLVLAVVIASRAAPWRPDTARLAKITTGVVAVAGVATLQFVAVGQWDGVPALGLAAAYACWRRGRAAAGAFLLAISAAVAKPHLALGLAAFMLGWRDRRAIAAAAGGVLAVVLASLLAVGVGGFSAFVSADLADATRWPLRSLLGFTGLFGSWLGDTGGAHLLAAAGTVAAMAVCVVLGTIYRRRGDLLEPALAGAVVLSLVASPHLLLHDLVLLAPVLVWTVAGAGRRIAVVAGLWALVNAAASLDLGNSTPAPPGRLVPWVLLIAGICAVVVARDGIAAGAARGPTSRQLAAIALPPAG